MNAVHYCALMGHAAILHKMLQVCPDLVSEKDSFEENTVMHCLMNNVMSGRREIQHMFVSILSVNQDVCQVKNIKEKTPLDLLEDRIAEANPYDTNLPELKEVCLEKLRKICRVEVKSQLDDSIAFISDTNSHSGLSDELTPQKQTKLKSALKRQQNKKFN
jgi:hypothetical protein